MQVGLSNGMYTVQCQCKKIVWGLIFVFRGCSGLKVDNVGAMTSLKKPLNISKKKSVFLSQLDLDSKWDW